MKPSINIHILKASGRLEPFRKDIEKYLELAIQKTREKLPMGNVDIVVYDDPANVIPGFCHGARTLDPYTVRISLDPKFPNFKNALKAELPRTISHELHHTVRWKFMGKTLLDAMIFEGLASRFEQEVWGGKPPAWATALSKDKLLEMLDLARKEYNSTTYDYIGWFFGKKKFSRWTGYSLGYFLVSEYIKKHPDETAAFLVSKPARIFIE